MLRPSDVIPHLGKGKAHWREGFSAHALATTWFVPNDNPKAVRSVLDSHLKFRNAQLVGGIFERKTDLRDGVQGHSQTDLLVILGVGRELAVAAIEGKVDETFGETVSAWLTNEEPHKKRHAANWRRH